MMFWHAIDHGETVVSQMQMRTLKLLDAPVTVPATSTKFASNCTMPANKALDGSWTDRRLCFDLRAVNEASEPDRHPLPLAEELFRSMAGSKLFTVIGFLPAARAS
jgi:hypothetical protein